MPTQLKEGIAVADLDAVREFLLTGREIPRNDPPKKPHRKSQPPVLVHNGITRARGHSPAKA